MVTPLWLMMAIRTDQFMQEYTTKKYPNQLEKSLQILQMMDFRMPGASTSVATK
jgi:hypothetical protein